MNRTLLLCSGCSATGKLQDTIFLGEVNNFEFIVVHRSKGISAFGRREGRVQWQHPSLSSPKGTEKSADICQISTLCEENTSSGGRDHRDPTKHNSTRSNSTLMQNQPSRQDFSFARLRSPSLKAQISTDDLCHPTQLRIKLTHCRPSYPGRSRGTSYPENKG